MTIRLRQLSTVALFGALYGVIFWICYRDLDPDFGWALEAGRYISAHGVPAHDVFTYTARNFPWIDHEWLSDVLIAALYRLGGMAMVAAVFAGVWLAALLVAARKHWPVAALAGIGLIDFFTIRPLAFTGLLLALMVVIWQRPQWRWLLIPLFGLWANLHGGFALGLAILGFLIVWERQWRWWWLLAAAVIATFINPYGPRLYVEVWRTLSDHNLMYQVEEWEPLQLTIWIGLYAVGVLGALVALGGWRRSVGILTGGLTVAAAASARFFMPFVIMSLPLVAHGYTELMHLVGKRRWVVPAFTLGALLLLSIAFVRQLPITNAYPVAAVASLRAHPCQGNIFNEYDFGGYLIWQLPGVPVYIDGRMPSWKGPQGYYINQYFQVKNGGSVVNKVFAHYDITCAILYNGDRPLPQQLAHEGWKASAKDSTATLWRKRA
ncbi:MAG TPA: hypothetical protein VMR75_03585 [Candidatus Saccharimonadales bacterium]|nr:hypothetical protein [Candidatus Saccharimonadales bacterium]